MNSRESLPPPVEAARQGGDVAKGAAARRDAQGRSGVRYLEVTLSLTGEPSTRARATLVDHGLSERLVRALTMLGALWGIGALCILLPIVHFVLVPAFLLAGLVFAWLRLRDGCSLVEVSGVCPRCKVPRTLRASGRYREGRQVHCESCGSQLEVRAGPADAPG